MNGTEDLSIYIKADGAPQAASAVGDVGAALKSAGSSGAAAAAGMGTAASAVDVLKISMTGLQKAFMLEERERYIDYLIHCCSSTALGWDWQQTQVSEADDHIAECPTNKGNEGEFETDDKTEEELWAESQAKMDELADWVSGAVDNLLEAGGFEWWANNIIDYLGDKGFWDDAGTQSSPAAWMDMYKNATLSAGYYTTWWTTPTPSWSDKQLDPWPEYGTNHFLETTTSHSYEYDWRYSAAAGWLSGSKNSFHFTRSKCVSASTPEELRIPNGQYADLEAICVKSNHYARERYRQSDLDFFDAAADWVRLPFSLHEEAPLLPEIPACLVSACAAPTNLTLAVSEYDPPELTGGGNDGPLEYWAQNTNATPVVQSWVLQIGGDWSPIFEPTEYAVEVRSNAAWNVTINVESNGIYYTTNGLPRPWIAHGYYLTEDMQPVYLWTVTNDYDLLYTYAEAAHILDPPGMPEWDSYLNHYYHTVFGDGAITYQSCTNLPHGSTDNPPALDGVIHCDHDAAKVIRMTASLGYDAATNIVYFERSIDEHPNGGATTNWLAFPTGMLENAPYVEVGAPQERDIEFEVDDWPGEWDSHFYCKTCLISPSIPKSPR